MGDLTSDGGEFSCKFCQGGNLKLTVTNSSSSGESKKLSHKLNCLIPPGKICTFPQSLPPTPCPGIPPGMMTSTDQSTVVIDKLAQGVGEGACFMCVKGQKVTRSGSAQHTGKYDEAEEIALNLELKKQEKKAKQKKLARRKSVNMPSLKKLELEMEHILSGHSPEGTVFEQSGIKSQFPSTYNEKQIERSIKQAYNRGKCVKRQVSFDRKTGKMQERATIIGFDDNGLKLRIYVNLTEKKIETAFPPHMKKPMKPNLNPFKGK